ncbi:MAG: hypothetical protein ABSF10_20895, partial [Verrucomicrobiota bacterium]
PPTPIFCRNNIGFDSKARSERLRAFFMIAFIMLPAKFSQHAVISWHLGLFSYCPMATFFRHSLTRFAPCAIRQNLARK